MKHPVEILMDEHREIERVLDAMEQRLKELPRREFPAGFFAKAIDFFCNFADGCHHFKEEEGLFPALVRAGMPVDGGPVAVMLNEHTIGRSCLAGIRQNLDSAAQGSAEAVDAIRQHAANYIHLLRHHIWKEDRILFQMAYQTLPVAEVDRLREQFQDETDTRINEPVRARYHALVDELTAQVAVAR